MKAHEVGGEYATGIVGKTFSKGQVIDVNILLSANHLGYFEFKLCPVYNEKVEVKQECLDKTLLKINGNSYKYNVMAGERSIDLKVKLPEDLTCKHCVMQWRYRAGNNWVICRFLFFIRIGFIKLGIVFSYPFDYSCCCCFMIYFELKFFPF